MPRPEDLAPPTPERPPIHTAEGRRPWVTIPPPREDHPRPPVKRDPPTPASRARWRARFASIGATYYPYRGSHHGQGQGQTWNQSAFRGRMNDGLEAFDETNGGATWEDVVNSNYDIALETNTRIRFVIARSASDFAAYNHELFYSYNGAGYLRVTASSSVIRTAGSPWYSNGDDTTDVNGRPGIGTFTPAINGGLVKYSDIQSGSVIPAGPGNDIEPEWCVKLVTADVSVSDTVALRVHSQAGTPFATYVFTPTLTVVAAPPLVQDLVISP